jgi:hypothetical protein
MARCDEDRIDRDFGDSLIIAAGYGRGLGRGGSSSSSGTLAVATDQNAQYKQYRRPTKRNVVLAPME